MVHESRGTNFWDTLYYIQTICWLDFSGHCCRRTRLTRNLIHLLSMVSNIRVHASACTLSPLLFFDHGYISFWNCRHCRRCKKRRSLRSNSFFEEFPRISLAKLLLCIYFFVEDDSQKSASRKVGLTKNKTSQIYRRLEDVCTVDLEYNPITPFGGPGIVVKCDESKFNHKAKVSNIFLKKVISRKSSRRQTLFKSSRGTLPIHECSFVAYMYSSYFGQFNYYLPLTSPS